MPLSKDDDVVQDLSSERSDETFGVPVLPGRSGRGLELAYVEVVHSCVERRAVDSVPIADESDYLGLGTNRFDYLLGGPRRVAVGSRFA